MTSLTPTDRAAATFELAAAMNHEHGNLLAALKAWIDAPGLGMPAQEALGHAAKIVEKMSRLQRAEQLCVAGLQNEALESIALDELLGHALVLASPRLRARGVTVAVDQPDVPPRLFCNPGKTIADLFFLLLRVAGRPESEIVTLVVSADLLGDDVQVTVFLEAAPNGRESLRIPAEMRK